MVMEMCIHSLRLQFKDRYEVGVETSCDAIYENHPYVKKFNFSQAYLVPMHYDLINWSDNVPVHFGQGFCEWLAKELKIPLRLQVNRPRVYFSPEEEADNIAVSKYHINGPMAILNAGRKDDYTAKWAGSTLYQEVVDHFAGRITFVQIGEAHHFHPPLRGARNLIGQTTTRELIRLCNSALFGVGPSTFIQHVFASLPTPRPYICLLGGREPVHWTHYPNQITLGTHGMLPCCQNRACWKSLTTPIPGHPQEKSVCALPVVDAGGDTIPECLARIGSGSVINAIETMLDSGVVKL